MGIPEGYGASTSRRAECFRRTSGVFCLAHAFTKWKWTAGLLVWKNRSARVRGQTISGLDRCTTST